VRWREARGRCWRGRARHKMLDHLPAYDAGTPQPGGPGPGQSAYRPAERPRRTRSGSSGMARPRSGCTASRTPVRSVTSRPTPKVSLNFAGDGTGGGIVFLPTAAVVRPDLPPDDQDPAYLAKYAEHIPRIGSTPRAVRPTLQPPGHHDLDPPARALTVRQFDPPPPVRSAAANTTGTRPTVRGRSAQIAHSGAIRRTRRATVTWRHIGGYRAMPAATNRHAARLAFQRVSVLIESVRLTAAPSGRFAVRRSPSSGFRWHLRRQQLRRIRRQGWEATAAPRMVAGVLRRPPLFLRRATRPGSALTPPASASGSAACYSNHPCRTGYRGARIRWMRAVRYPAGAWRCQPANITKDRYVRDAAEVGMIRDVWPLVLSVGWVSVELRRGPVWSLAVRPAREAS